MPSLSRSLRLVAGRYLFFVRCEGGEDFTLLTRRHFGEVKAAPQFGRYLVEFFRRDPELAMRVLKAQMGFAPFCRREFEGPSRNLADPQGSHELEARQPAQVLRVPFPEGRVLRRLAHDRVLDHCAPEMVVDRDDGKDAAKPFIQALLGFRSG